jgi:hypothetical protein
VSRASSFKTLAIAAIAALLAVPAAADAKGGGGGGGGGSAATCATLTPLNAGELDRPASGKTTTVDFAVRNCSTRTATLATSLVATTMTVWSVDPYEVRQCSGASYAAPTLTLKPGESRTIEATAAVPYCGWSPWGATAQYTVQYDATTRDTATGATVGTAISGINHTGGV